MLNSELLLMGKADPYPGTTNWMTVAQGTTSDNVGYGYYSGNYSGSPTGYGALSPSTFGSYFVARLIYSSSSTFLEFETNSNSTSNLGGIDIGQIKVTRLDTGKIFTATFKSMSGYKTDGDALGLSSSVGQKIPIKIEYV